MKVITQMKTTTSQTRHNGNAAPATSQGAKQPSPHYARFELEINGTLHPESVDFTEAEFAELKRVAEQHGGISAFIMSAIKDKVAAGGKLSNRLKMLVSGCDLCEDGMWATPEGALFLWSGAMEEAARPVTLTQANAWWQKFHAERPDFAPPFYPERTAAHEFVAVVCEAMNQAKSESVQDRRAA